MHDHTHRSLVSRAGDRLAALRGMMSRRDVRFLATIFGDSFRRIPRAPRKPDPSTWTDDRITAAWLGHATVLINFFGVKILTDPVLAARIGIRFGPLTIGPKRYVRPALTIRELPPPDLVLLTHAHMDHFDAWTLKHLDRGAVVVTAKSTRDLLDGMRFKNIIELGWGETADIRTANGSVSIHAFAVRHWGARMRHDDHRGYNGYLLERGGRRVCVTGDTARTDFSHVGGRGPIDLMFLPIGAYDPWIASHCNPEEAIAMANEARARFLFPIHHQTFKLSWEPMNEPIERFMRALAHEPERIAGKEIGGTFVVPQAGQRTRDLQNTTAASKQV